MSKPGVNWPAIECRIRSGESMRAVAKDHDISHVTISKRAKKYKWTGSEIAPRAEGQLSNVAATVAVLSEFIENGLSIETAAAKAGVSPDTLMAWKADPTILAAIKEARLSSLGDAEKAIYDAQELGDWKAAQARLKASDELPQWRDDRGTKVGAITVLINVQRSEEIEPPTIDVSPD